MKTFRMVIPLLLSASLLTSPIAGAIPAGDVGCNFNGDAYGDVAVSSQNEDIGSATDAGAVFIYLGSGAGLVPQLVINQDTPGVADAAESEDRFGATHVCGDFDGDGFDDLAVSAFGEDGPVNMTGGVHVFRGGPDGLTVVGDRRFTRATAGIPGSYPKTGPLGNELAVGDFNGDGYDDLAMGSVWARVGDHEQAGSVVIVLGSAAGLDTNTAVQLHQNRAGIRGIATANAMFGWSLAAADFDGDGRDDLAVGVPGPTEEGAVAIIYGGSNGLTARDQLLSQDSPGIESDALAHEEFGDRLTAGDIDGDGFGDLVIHISNEMDNRILNEGSIAIIYGRETGLGGRDQLFDQESPGIIGSSQMHDRFGAYLRLGDIDGDGFLDLVLGQSGKDIQGVANAGYVHVIYGQEGGMSRRDRIRHQAQPGVAGAPGWRHGYGAAPTTADVDGDGFWDAVIGIPGRDSANLEDSGGFAVIYGGANGITKRDKIYNQSPLDAIEPFDYFGV